MLSEREQEMLFVRDRSKAAEIETAYRAKVKADQAEAVAYANKRATEEREAARHAPLRATHVSKVVHPEPRVTTVAQRDRLGELADAENARWWAGYRERAARRRRAPSPSRTPAVLRWTVNATLFPITLVVALLAVLWLAGRGIRRAAS